MLKKNIIGANVAQRWRRSDMYVLTDTMPADRIAAIARVLSDNRDA